MTEKETISVVLYKELILALLRTSRMVIAHPAAGRAAAFITALELLAYETTSAQDGRVPSSVAQIEAAQLPTVWHPIAIRVEGPAHSETDDDPNPFVDYRLQIRLTAPSGKTFTVVGCAGPPIFALARCLVLTVKTLWIWIKQTAQASDEAPLIGCETVRRW